MGNEVDEFCCGLSVSIEQRSLAFDTLLLLPLTYSGSDDVHERILRVIYCRSVSC